jgi:hypothetical protein
MKEMKNPIWGMTPVNEPMDNNGAWESVNWSAEGQAQWLKEDYGPLLRS